MIFKKEKRWKKKVDIEVIEPEKSWNALKQLAQVRCEWRKLLIANVLEEAERTERLFVMWAVIPTQ